MNLPDGGISASTAAPALGLFLPATELQVDKTGHFKGEIGRECRNPVLPCVPSLSRRANRTGRIPNIILYPLKAVDRSVSTGYRL